MARDAADREDLLAEATALVERIELKLPDRAENIVVGFRRDGAVSFYFGSEPVYQFNAQRQLRRAFLDGKLVKADRGTLAALTPVRLEGRTELRRHDLSPDETTQLIQQARFELTNLSQAIECKSVVIARQVPEAADLIGRVQSWLQRIGSTLEVASSARV